MRKQIMKGWTWLILLVLIIPSAPSHVPDFPKGNSVLSGAKSIDRPSKSWAEYAALSEAREAHYYSFEVDAGERIKLQLLVSTDPDQSDFLPSLVLLAPGLATDGIPDFVEVPEGYGVIVAESRRPERPRYEGFSPSSFYEVGGLDIAAPSPGTYYVAVYSATTGGSYSLILGYLESFSPVEWILIPVNLIPVYRWNGQSWIEILMPMLVIVVVGLVLFIRSVRRRSDGSTQLFQLSLVFVGLTYLGTTATILYQLAFNLTRVPPTPEIAITLTFAALPLIVGVAALNLGLGDHGGIDIGTRARVLAIGLLGLIAWAGMVVGPAVAISTIFLPDRPIRLGRPGAPG